VAEPVPASAPTLAAPQPGDEVTLAVDPAAIAILPA
jgi:hypothetical protein